MYNKISTKEEYDILLKSGMFWEFHPELSGDWEKDKNVILAGSSVVGNLTDSIRLYNMDCMELLKDTPDKFYDLAIVDPPYGINLAEWDKETPKQKYFDEIRRVSVNQIIWGGNYFADKLPITEAWICWYKKPFLPQQAHFELAWTSFNMKPKLIEYTYAGNAEGLKNIRVDYTKKAIHPAQKPETIYKWLLHNYAKQGDKILDTHAGSFSIGIACDDMGFDLTATELDTDYYESAVKRFKTYKSQTKLAL